MNTDGPLDRASLWYASLEDRTIGDALEERIDQLFHDLRVPLYCYLLVLVRNTAEAEDLTQESFLRLYGELLARRPVQKPKSWLFRTAHNLAIDRQRQSTWRADDSFEVITRDLADDNQPSIESVLVQAEQRALVRRAMDRLSTQQRTCLYLRTEGFRYREIADIMGVSESTVCENIRRGLTRISKEIHD